MNPKKSPRQRPRLSFAVDRDEIDISSDWVEAVMESPAPPVVEPSPFLTPETKTATVEHIATVEATSTVEVSATVEVSSTVEASATVALLKSRPGRTFRPRLIRHLGDGLTGGQLNVYSAMHSRTALENGVPLYRGGYSDLCAQTGLSKRGIQNVIAELLGKTVVIRHQPPGYHRSQMTIYRVLSEEAILLAWQSRGLRYAVGKSKTLTNSATVALQATS